MYSSYSVTSFGMKNTSNFIEVLIYNYSRNRYTLYVPDYIYISELKYIVIDIPSYDITGTSTTGDIIN